MVVLFVIGESVVLRQAFVQRCGTHCFTALVFWAGFRDAPISMSVTLGGRLLELKKVHACRAALV